MRYGPVKAQARYEQAKDVVERCIGPRGIYAGTLRYKYQYWTRDFVLAGLNVLVQMGRADVAKAHLSGIAARQKSSGKIPIMFLQSRFGFMRIHFWDFVTHPLRFVEQVKLYVKKGLWKKGFSFENITPWSADTEPLFIIGCYHYGALTGDTEFLDAMKPHIRRAAEYVERNLMRDDGLVYGGDWRDVMVYLDDTALLSVNALMYRAYVLMHEHEKAYKLLNAIERAFWNGSYYRDRLGSEDFDTFGESLAVLFYIVPEARYKSVCEAYKTVACQYGFKVNNNSSENTDIPKSVQAFTDQYGTIWPFITGYAILALICMRRGLWSAEALICWNHLKGFYEWYDPEAGGGLGDREQMWSAALYMQVYDSLKSHDFFNIAVQ